MGKFGGWSCRLFPTTLPLNGTLEYSRGALEHQILNDCVFRFLVRFWYVGFLLLACWLLDTDQQRLGENVVGPYRATNKQVTRIQRFGLI